MTERLIKEYMNKVFVTLPCEIVEIDSGTSLMTVKPIIFDSLELPLIVDVPMQYIGSIDKHLKFKFKQGHRIMCLFSQLDLGVYIASGTTGQTNSKQKFNLTSCIGLPVLAATEKDSMSVPEFDFEIFGDVKITGKMEITGDIDHAGKLTNKGEINSNGVILETHVHDTPKPEHVLPGFLQTEQPKK